ncbi:MAG: extracellular solute-binding protein, partial [Candidatus Omnitrophica bacterium]|nr:extracellular solute-binding protein [Candidatus Omnitrophota bacterium]
MLKNFTIWFLMIYILFGSVCLKAEPAQEPVTLKLFQMPDPKNLSAFNQADLAVVRAFQEKYPYINLKRFSGIQIQGMGMDSGPLLAIAGGTSPDVIYVNFRQSDTYIQQGFLYPMDEYMEDISEELQNLRVAKPVWPVIKRQGPDNKKHVYALPYNLYIRALCYRKDLFAKVGLDPEQPPKDWKEFYEYAQKLTVPENKTYGLFMASGPSAAWDFMCYLWSAGGDAVVQDENGQWQAVFDSDEAVEALLFYLKLITPKWTDSEGRTHEGYVLRSGIDNTAWSEGRLGMRMQYLDEKSIGRGIDPSILGIAPVPLGPTGLRGSELNCTMMGIFAGQKDKRVRDAAWKYIWFYDSEEARKIRMQVMIENGYGKLMNPVYLKRYGYEEYLEEVPKTWLPVFEEALTNGKPEPYGKNCQMVYQFMTKPIDQAIALEYRGKLGSTDDEKRKKLKEILTAAVARTNKEMIGKLSVGERKF